MLFLFQPFTVIDIPFIYSENIRTNIYCLHQVIKYHGTRIREYHFALGACLPYANGGLERCPNPPCEWTLSKLDVHIEVLNSFTDASKRHLSNDEYDILNACIWTLSLTIVCIVVTCKSLELHHRNATLHWMNALLFVSQLLTTIVYGLTITELNRFGESGRPNQRARVIIAVFQTCQQSCLLLITLLYTKGWLYGREKISSRGRVFIGIACALFFVGTLFLLIFSTAGLVVVPKSLPMRVAPYAGSAGIVLVVLRSVIAAWMLFVILTTLKRDRNSKVGRVGLLGILWLVVPCVVNVAVVDQEPCSDRPQVIITEAICTLLLLYGLEFALWPFSSTLDLLRSRTSVKKANVQLSLCLRSGGLSICRVCCCPTTLVYVIGKKSLPEQSQEIKNDISFMHRKIMVLTEILRAMLQTEMKKTNCGGKTTTSLSSSGVVKVQQFGGGMGTMEEVQKSIAAATARAAFETTAKVAKVASEDVWNNKNTNGTTSSSMHSSRSSSSSNGIPNGVSASSNLAQGDTYDEFKRNFVLPAVK